jgi:hypothetical protein
MTFKTEEFHPNSLRIDHEDLGEVCKTTYAKGVIKDFKKVRDDPLEVKSLVKVEVEGVGESDFIPLFYHPKPQYWDDKEHQATDYNEEEQYFEKAWMSFRGDDEVVVILREGKPVAVLGFADGKPRIGEDIVKVQVESYEGEAHTVHIQCSKKGEQYKEVDAESKGPDDLDLGLAKEAQQLCNTGEQLVDTFKTEIDWWNHSFPLGTLSNIAGYDTYYHYMQYIEWLIVVGPMMYIFQVLKDNSRVYYERFPNQNVPGDTYRAYWGNWVYGTSSLKILAAIYTDELKKSILALGQSNSDLNLKNINDDFHEFQDDGYFFSYPKFQYQNDFTINLQDNQYLYVPRGIPPFEVVLDPTKFRFLTRPHNEKKA